jgi:hypothetical protein
MNVDKIRANSNLINLSSSELRKKSNGMKRMA